MAQKALGPLLNDYLALFTAVQDSDVALSSLLTPTIEDLSRLDGDAARNSPPPALTRSLPHPPGAPRRRAGARPPRTVAQGPPPRPCGCPPAA